MEKRETMGRKAIRVRSNGRLQALAPYSMELDRKLNIVKLSNQGMSLKAIAQHLGLSLEVVRKDYWLAIGEVAGEYQKYAHLIAAKQLQKLQYMERAIAEQVKQGDLKAIAQQIKLLEHEARLLNLYPESKPMEVNQIILINAAFPGSPQVEVKQENDTPLLEDYTSYTAVDEE